MKKVKVEEAVGMELCHDVTAMYDGFKGPAFRRGHRIRPEDIPRLLDFGKQTVYVWEAAAGEVHEEDAARRLAALCQPDNASYTGPSEGKMVLTARERGMLRVDTGLLRELNAIGDITITTLPDHYPVQAGARLASLRIVPLVTQEEQLRRAEELCQGRTLLRLCPYGHRKVGVIVTGSEVYHGRIQDKFEPVVREKLKAYPAEILGVTLCDDDLEMIAAAGENYRAMGADLLLFTGGMSVDPDDLTPGAIRRMGAEIVSHGVPAQPGNMTLVAYLDSTAILGVPGADISLPTTIFDVLLPQIFAGERLTKGDLISLGDGGLCQLCKPCHWPNCTFGRY